MLGRRQQQNVCNFQTFNFHGRILIEFPVFYETVEIVTCGAPFVNGRTAPAANIPPLENRAEGACLSNDR